MKKILSVLSLIAILSAVTPVYAAPGGPGGPGGPHHGGPRGGHVVRVGHHHVHRGPHVPPPRVHGHIGVGGVLARRSYWSSPYYCDYRLGWCDDYYYYPPYHYRNGVYVNLGIPIRF